MARWGRTTAGLAVGGMLFVAGMLALVRGLATITGSGTLIASDGAGVMLVGVAWLIASIVTLFVLRIVRLRCGTIMSALAVWSIGYTILWAIGANAGTISLPVFVLFWIAAAALRAIFWARAPVGTRPPGRRRAVRQAGRATARLASAADPQAVMRRSEFGRIPATTLNVIASQVRAVSTDVVGALPVGAANLARAETIRMVLARTLRDWWENGNAEGLPSQDVADLQSFVALAAAVAGDWRAPGALPVYRATLAALLDDWLLNWNAGGVDGPPVRETATD